MGTEVAHTTLTGFAFHIWLLRVLLVIIKLVAVWL